MLTRRQLNRALLARQHLLSRTKATPADVIEQLAGMQAQVPRPPFVGLWTRMQKFQREDLLALYRARKVVRATAMRGTIHLLTTKDFLLFRPRLADMLVRGANSIVGKRLGGADIEPFYKAGREFFTRNSAPFEAFRAAAKSKWPKLDVRAIAYTVRLGVPLVMVPTGERWGFSSNADFTFADAWLRKAVPASSDDLDLLVMRYLAAFGPATPGDAQTWSGLRDLRPVFERLRKKLVTFRDERKRELFDLPKAPRPDADTPAPVRFLPEYDNVALSHDDRTRIIADEHRGRLVTKNLIVVGGFTVDGFIAGTWRVGVKKKVAALRLSPFAKLARSAAAELVAEGERLLEFVEADADAKVVGFSK
ncbi:MAG: winged helix DNA-binding domain-containing protein [Gemmatimonadota bacterium]